MAIERITVGGVTYTRRVRGVSKGGVVLPPGSPFSSYVSQPLRGVPTGEAPEPGAPIAEEFRNPFFVPNLKAAVLPERRDEFGAKTPVRLLGEENAKMRAKAVTDLCLFIQCPIAADHAVIPLIAELLVASQYTRRIEGPDGAERNSDLEREGRLSHTAARAGAAPLLRIGWTAAMPGLVDREFDWWSIEGEPWYLVGAEGKFFPKVLVDHDPFDIAYEVPLVWSGASRPRDPLMVGHGNYAPRHGDFLYVETDAARKAVRTFEAGLSAGELAALRASEPGGDPEAGERAAEALAIFESLGVYYETWEKLWKELEAVPSYHGGFGSEEEILRIIALEGQIAEQKSKGRSLATYKEQTSNERGLREEKGPFLNDVPNWAYRFNLSKPPGGLPDFTTSGGFLVIQLTCLTPGARWDGFSGGFYSPGVGTLLTGAGFITGDPTQDIQAGEWAVEMQSGSESVGVAPQLGTILSGAVAR